MSTLTNGRPTGARADIRGVDFRFVAALPADAHPGWFAHYDHVPAGPTGWRMADVRGAIDAHVDEWLDDFDAWHAALSGWAEARSPWWWVVRGSRPNVWGARRVLKPLLFATGLLEWAAAVAPGEPVYVLGAPPDVAIYLEELRTGSSAARGRERDVLRAVAVALAEAARELRTLIRHYLFRRPARARARILFYSHVVDMSSLAAVGDHFFGTMVDAAEQAHPGDVLLGFFLHVDGDRAAAETTLRARGRRFCFVLDYLSLADVVWVAVQLLRLMRAFARDPQGLPALRLGPWASRAFLSRYFAAEVRRWLPVAELAVYRAMRRLLEASGARTIVYPYEEKGVERGILRAASEAGGLRTMAYGHAAHTRAHLGLRTRRGALNPPAPDVLLATGPQAARFLVEWGGKATERVVAVGSPRHLPAIAYARGAEERRRRLRVLFIVGHGLELTTFANFIETRPDIPHEHDVLVRTTVNWRDEQEAAIRRLRVFAPTIRVGNEQTLVAQLGWCDVAVFDSTTAGVQAMLAGRVSVHAALHDVFPADPLHGLPGVFADCADADRLADALARARALDDETYAQVVARQRELATAILAPLDAQRFAQVLVVSPAPGGARGGF